MIRKSILAVFIFALLTACTLTPEDKLIQDLVPKLTEIDIPSGIQVYNSHTTDTITLTWNPVENATYYVVEYQRIVDALAGKKADELPPTDQNYIDFKVPDGNNGNEKRDKRYVFRVKAVNIERNASNQIISTLDSGYSDYVEGVIADYLSVQSVVIENNVITNISYNISDVSAKYSNAETIAELELKYYEQEYEEDIQIDPTWPSEDSLKGKKLASGKDYSYIVVLFADGNVTAIAPLNFSGDLDFNPPAVSNMKVQNNLEDSIVLTWDKVIPDESIKDLISVRYAVMRKLSSEEEWTYIVDEENRTLLLEDTSYIDSDILNDKDYDYQILTAYIRLSDNSEHISESATTVYNCHAVDTKPSLFTATTDSNSIIDTDESYSVTINLAITPRSADITDCEQLKYKVYRGQYGTDAEPVLIYEGKENAITDKIALDTEAHRFDKTFYYFIEYYYGENLLTKEEVTASDSEGNLFLHEVSGSVEVIEFIRDFSANDIAKPFADKIHLEWEIYIPEDSGLEESDLLLTLARREVSSAEFTHLFSGKGYKSYDDLTAVPGKEYVYRLTAEYSDSENPENVYNGQQYIPETVIGRRLSIPDGLYAEKNLSENQLAVSWNAVKDANYYLLCFRPYGSSGKYEEKKVENANQDTISTVLTVDDDNISAGTEYEIAVKAVDFENMATAFSESDKGSILGPLTLKVEEGADYVKISWEEGENISVYGIYVLNGQGNIVYNTIVYSGSAPEFILDANNLPEEMLESEYISSYPLSEKYYFAVIPGSLNVSSMIDIATEGSWIRPPKNIKATKAAYRDLIQITWDPVEAEANEGYEQYAVYRKNHGSSDAWTLVEYTTLTTYSYLSTNEEYDFSVASVKDGTDGIVQNCFAGDDNYGYPLLQPKRTTAQDLGNGYFQIQFEEVKGATEYIINLEGRDSLIISKQAIDEAKNDKKYSAEYGDGNYFVSSSDTIAVVTVYLNKVPINRKLTWTASVAARNTDAVYSEKNTTEPINFIKQYAYNPDSQTNGGLKAVDFLKVIFLNLHDIMEEVDKQMESDWWRMNQTKVEISGGKIEASSSWGETYNWDWDATYHSDNDGYILFNGYVSNNIEFTHNDIENKLVCKQHDTVAGYANSDNTLDTISGSLTVILPYIYPVYTFTFDNYHVYDNTGSISMKNESNGEITQNVNVSEILPKGLFGGE